MTVKALQEVVSPPSKPIDSEKQDLAQVVDFLGTPLPDDYLALSEIYGTGSFGDTSYYF